LRKEGVTANDALAESNRGQRYALLELLTVDLAYRKRPVTTKHYLVNAFVDARYNSDV